MTTLDGVEAEVVKEPVVEQVVAEATVEDAVAVVAVTRAAAKLPEVNTLEPKDGPTTRQMMVLTMMPCS